MRRAFFSLGTNLGDRSAHLLRGVSDVVGGDPHRVSSVYETSPVGGVVQDDFWNLVVELTCTDSPRELLGRAQRAEAAAGRTREIRWGPRTLDVDVLWIDGATSEDPEITVPHPRMWERRFVLVPLAELAPELVAPSLLERATGDVVCVGTLNSLR